MKCKLLEVLIRCKEMIFHCVFKSLKNAGTFIIFGIYASFIVGTEGVDVLSDAGLTRDYVYANQGNDVVIYTPALNKNTWDHYDGGQGIDTFWLRMTANEFYHPMFQADLIRFHYFVFNHVRVSHGSDQGPLFKFSSFNLTVRNFEKIIIEKVSAHKQYKGISEPTNLFHIKDSTVDSLV